MNIKTQEDMDLFEAALDSCRQAVWLVAPSGLQYNLKSRRDRVPGLSRLKRDAKGELELFASNPHDEMILLECYGRLSA